MLNTKAWYQLMNRLDGLSLTTSVSGGAGTCVAKMFADKIHITVTNASAGQKATSTINTPIGFEVVGMKAVKTSAEDEANMVTIKNTANVISTAISIATQGLTKSTSTLGTSRTFGVDDNDLVVLFSGTSTGTFVVVLDIVVV